MAIYLALFLVQWQQGVGYRINAALDIDTKSLAGIEYLTYYNRSPHTLETLFVHLYANAYKDVNTTFAREMKRLGGYGSNGFFEAPDSQRGYCDIRSATAADAPIRFEIDETILRLILNRPLGPGDSIVVGLDFYLKIPRQFSRLGYKGNHYEMVQWYPKICVFDEDGWHRDPYHALGEFYGEFGSYDVVLDIPGDYVVAATGERVDEDDQEFIDGIIVGKRLAVAERRTVRFKAEHVHDFAWVGDPDFLIKKYEIDSTAIFVFYLKPIEREWQYAGAYALDAVKRYNEWFGKYPYKNLSVVFGYQPSGEGMEYPNLVIVCIAEDRLTRFFEQVVAHEIGHQWFYGVLGSNELDEAWLDEGFTSYAEIRYFEDKYGPANSLHKLPFLSPLSCRYLRQVVYYITQTNGLEVPVLIPAYELIETPIVYMNNAYAKPALFLFSLEYMLGKDTFDRILKRYYQEFRFRHPGSEDFIRICEEESGEDLQPLFEQFLMTNAFCDWRIRSVGKDRVEIENRGTLPLPVEVEIKGDKGIKRIRIDKPNKIHDIHLEDGQTIKQVIINPEGQTLETDYWNNAYPARIEFKPIIDIPSLNTYQIFYLPYPWYSSYDGITANLFLLGTEFPDFDFVKGRHQWTLGLTYGFKSRKLNHGFSYGTPIVFKKGVRCRLELRGSNSNDEYKYRVGLNTALGIPLSSKPRFEITTLLSYYRLNSYNLVDSLDWDLGRNIYLDNYFKFKHRNLDIGIGVALANEVFNSEYEYLKLCLEVENEMTSTIPFRIRFFAGRIFGTAPRQERFFLSGGLRISMLADLFFSQKDYFSPQEHLHIPGDGNMLGYQTMHIKSDRLYCVNLELPSRFPLRIFADFGYFGEYAYDFGARLVLGPISLNFPFYTKTDEPWKFRWSIGL